MTKRVTLVTSVVNFRWTTISRQESYPMKLSCKFKNMKTEGSIRVFQSYKTGGKYSSAIIFPWIEQYLLYQIQQSVCRHEWNLYFRKLLLIPFQYFRNKPKCPLSLQKGSQQIWVCTKKLMFVQVKHRDESTTNY